mmetsp:Transcript_11664/g.11587  ORF Transcript_11664/g.11587 Transcript_11664/m.11587 type:complete len:88 (+) Transcript_11664:495-758(+)
MHGLSLVLAFYLIKSTLNFLGEHTHIFMCMLGSKAWHALEALLYSKILRISEATTSNYSQGEIINLVRHDSHRLHVIGELFVIEFHF